MKNLILNFLFLVLTTSHTLATNDINFTLADITLEYEQGKDSIILEAYKTANNDKIIESKDKEKYSQLNWFSIGNPTISKILPQEEIFNFRPDGFDIFVELLNKENKNRLVEAIQKKYNISVNNDQILTLKPDRFECQIELYDDGHKLILYGKAADMFKFPLRVIFPYPDSNLSTERKVLEKRLQKDGYDPDLEIKCEAYSQDQAYRENTLILSSKQINQLNLVDSIFGSKSKVFISMNQINRLSQEIYQRLNIFEEYQIFEKEFELSFIQEFLKLTSNFVNRFVLFETALDKLSLYNLETSDFNLETFKQKMSELFTIINDRENQSIEINKSLNQNLIEDFLEINFDFLNLNESLNYFISNKNSKTISEQLEQLNNFEQNQIDWIQEENKIVPGRIKVSQLDKIKFLNGLVFKEISKKLYHSEYSSAFYLNKGPTHYSNRDKDNINLPESLKNSVYLEYWNSAFAQNHQYKIRTGYWRIGKPLGELIEDFAKMRSELHYFGTPKISNFIYNFTADLVGFKYKPHIFYSYKTVSSFTHQILYELVTIEVTKTRLECQFILKDTFENAEFVIEWLAIGP